MTHLPTFILAGCIAVSVSTAHAQATSVSALSPASQDVVVHSASELERRMQAGATPLDALTPYGRREFLRGLHWGEKNLSGFSYAPLMRELLPEQITAIAKFLGFEPYVKSLLVDAGRFSPLRLPEPDAALEQRVVVFTVWMDAQSRAQASNSNDALTRNDHSTLLARFQQEFADELQPNYLAQAKDGDLALLFQLSQRVAFVALSPTSADAVNRIYQVLKARGLETRRGMDRGMLEILLRQREFDKAGAFVAQHPDLDADVIPRIKDRLPANFQGRSVYNYDPQSNTLTRKVVQLSAGKQLVMVVGAGCHFSRDALAAIGKSMSLQQRLLGANLLITTPPSDSIPFYFIQQWNAKHPDMAMVAPARREEWQDIDVPSVPMFYLYENGRLQQRFEGWYPETTMREILSALDKQ